MAQSTHKNTDFIQLRMQQMLIHVSQI